LLFDLNDLILIILAQLNLVDEVFTMPEVVFRIKIRYFNEHHQHLLLSIRNMSISGNNKNNEDDYDDPSN
jgi:hypothetical protein